MAKFRLRKIVFTILCDCGKVFIAEDFKPQCPYCDREYSVSMSASPEKLEVGVVKETPLESHT
jgi:hypothetical protein